MLFDVLVTVPWLVMVEIASWVRVMLVGACCAGILAIAISILSLYLSRSVHRHSRVLGTNPLAGPSHRRHRLANPPR